jgi:hypothetical protein
MTMTIGKAILFPQTHQLDYPKVCSVSLVMVVGTMPILVVELHRSRTCRHDSGYCTSFLKRDDEVFTAFRDPTAMRSG